MRTRPTFSGHQPDRSRICTCFFMPVSVISNFAASSLIDASRRPRCSSTPRRRVRQRRKGVIETWRILNHVVQYMDGPLTCQATADLTAAGRAVPPMVNGPPPCAPEPRNSVAHGGTRVALILPMPSDLLTDLRFSARSLARTPVWTLTLVLTIALGIGSTASVQGFVRGLMPPDLPIPALQNVATVLEVDPEARPGPVFATFGASGAARHLSPLGAIRESKSVSRLASDRPRCRRRRTPGHR